MNYNEIRSIAKDGDILFFHVDKRRFLSKLVSWFTKSQYTHVGFVFWFKNRLMLIDSGIKGGSRIILASKYYDNTFDLVSAPKIWSDIEERALARSGTAHYGWFSAAYIGIREFMFTHFHIQLPMDKKNRNKACSEFVAEILNLEDVDISPGMLYKKLSQ
jgi:hypothetical protein